jgi:hypothetical protein
LGHQLLQHGQHNSTFWILSINCKESMTAPTVVTYLKSIQHASTTTYVSAIFAHRVASHRTTLAGNRVLFNQIRLLHDKPSIVEPSSPSIIVPVGLKVISSPICPETPTHFGATFSSPFASDWKDALF